MSDLRLLVLDVDGVLTDGRLLWGYFGDNFAEPIRAFHVHDGLAIQWFRRHVGEVALLTAKKSMAVVRRSEELGLRHVIQGSRDKLADLRQLLQKLGVPPEQTAMMGDDFPDLPVLRAVGYPMAPANAATEVQAIARYVTRREGGDGAVREAIEHLLRRQGVWETVLADYGISEKDGAERILQRQTSAEDGPRS